MLLPPWEVVRERNRHHDRPLTARLPETMLRTIYDDMLPWRDRPSHEVPVIDTSALNVAETVDAIDAAVAHRS